MLVIPLSFLIIDFCGWKWLNSRWMRDSLEVLLVVFCFVGADESCSRVRREVHRIIILVRAVDGLMMYS